MPNYAFRKVGRGDLPMLLSWLKEPHLEGWWDEPHFELHLIEEELDDARVDMRVVELDGTPFAFIQDYNAHAFGAPQYSGYPEAARAVDTFLGDPAFLGQGHGAGYLEARSDILMAQGAPVVLVDPDPKNTRAIAAYAKAGFDPGPVLPCEDGDLVQIMVRHARVAHAGPGALHGRARRLRQRTLGLAPV